MYEKSDPIVVLFAVMALVSLAVGPALAVPVTQSITYQGKLTNAAGSPLNGTYSLKFSLYQASSGGTALASSTQSVTSTNGLFTTPIAFSSSFFDGRALWLGIQVGADPEMTPRQEIRPVPYALSLRPGALITADGNEYGIRVNKSDTGGEGYLAYSEGASSKGFYSVMKGTSSNGFMTTMYGSGGAGVSAVTHGTNSPGVFSRTWSSGSTGVVAQTSADNSYGVNVTTSGFGSDGMNIQTTGQYSPGVFANTTEYGSNAIYGISNAYGTAAVAGVAKGVNAYGIYGRTENAGSPAVYGDSAQDVGVYGIGKEGGSFTTNQAGQWRGWLKALNVTTVHDYNPGVMIRTDGEYSYGINAETHGEYSYGMYVQTSGDDGKGLYVETLGQGGSGVNVWTYNFSSPGVIAYSSKSTGIDTSTGRADHKWGLHTEDYIYAGGIQAPDVDIAEYMPVIKDVTPGTVLIIGPDGTLEVATTEYDTRVAGIVSTSPAITLGNKEYGTSEETDAREVGMDRNTSRTLVANEAGNAGEVPVAIAGRVPCKVDASYGSIHAGDLLTTSDTPGHAMKAEPTMMNGRGFYPDGTILGKAMGSLESGTGVIEVLVTLQ